MRINHNIAALNTHRQLNSASTAQSKSMEKLSSGLRINKAGDDAAGLAISEKMRAQVRGLDQASRNSQDAISLIQTAEGALSETTSILQRMRELATQAANDTNTANDRAEIQKEINQLTSEINRIGNTTEFNTQKLLKGDISATSDGKGIKAGSVAITGNLSNLAVDSNSTLAAGKYKIEVENLGGKTVQNLSSGQNVGTTMATVAQNTVNADLDLAEGSYKVKITNESAKNTSDIGTATADQTGQPTAGTQVFNTDGTNKAITVDAGSTLDDGKYYVKVDKATVKEIGAVVAGGISDLKLVSGAEATKGTYTIKTAASVAGTDGGAQTLTADSAIKNIKIAEGSTYDNTKGYKIQLVQTETIDAGTAGQAAYTIKLVNADGDVASATANFTVTATSGTTSMTLGDMTFDIDLSKMYANANATPALNGTYNGAEVNLTIGTNISITQNSSGAVVTKAVGAGLADQEFDFSTDGGTGKLTLDATAATIRGNTLTTNVTYEDKYTVGLYNSSNALQGTALTILEGDLSDPEKLTNIQLGTAAQGVLADLKSTGLISMTAAESVKMSFAVGTAVQNTAQIVDIDGITAIGGKVALESTNSAQETDLGKGLKLSYNGSTVATGDLTFSVKDVKSADDFKISLKQDTNNDGTYDTTIVNQQAFNVNDEVTLGTTGVKIDSAINVANGNSAAFEISDTSTDNSLQMQIGANTGQSFSVDISDMRSKALEIAGKAGATNTVTEGTGADQKTYTAKFTTTNAVTDGTTSIEEESALDVSSHDNATAAIKVINSAIEAVSAERSKLGAFQNRLEHTINNLSTSSENLTAAESRVRDIDMAKEMMEQTKNSILAQAAQAMLAQANQQPQGVLQLLR